MCMCFECVQEQQLDKGPIVEIQNSKEFSAWSFEQTVTKGHTIVGIVGEIAGIPHNVGFRNVDTGEEFRFVPLVY